MERQRRKIRRITLDELQGAHIYTSLERPRKVRVKAARAKMPRDFCLSENFVAVAEALIEIRKNIEYEYQRRRRGGRPLPASELSWVDMSTIKKITPAGALALASEFDRLRKLGCNSVALVDVHKWDNEVFFSLWDLGLFAILGIERVNRPLVETPSSVLLTMRSNSLAVPDDALRFYDDIQGLLGGLSAGDLTETENRSLRAEIYGIIIEAMENVATHAYPEDGQYAFTHVPLWWLTAAVNKTERKLTVVMYDQGVTIPVSLPKWKNYTKIDLLLKRWALMTKGREMTAAESEDDGLAIRAAMKVAVTATDQSHRGKGLPRMKKFIDHCRAGRLRILSRRGEYVYRKNDKTQTYNHPAEFGGTLIEWEVSL